MFCFLTPVSHDGYITAALFCFLNASHAAMMVILQLHCVCFLTPVSHDGYITAALFFVFLTPVSRGGYNYHRAKRARRSKADAFQQILEEKRKEKKGDMF